MSRVIVVTGSNKGIGYAIVKKLLMTNASDVVYLTSRDVDRGKVAVKELEGDGLFPRYHQLDITSPSSVSSFAHFLKEEHGGVDILVNNAGIAFKVNATDPFHVQAEVQVGTNYFGTLSLTQTLLPLIRDGGRIVFVSGQLGHAAYAKMSPELQERFDDKDLTVDGLSGLMMEFIDAAKVENHVSKGWPNMAYGMTKVGVTTLARLLQSDYDASQPKHKDVFIAACCPGRVITDMSSHEGDRTPEQGADTPVFLATLPPGTDKPKGHFWFDREVKDWGK